jgi:beta-phosphoglucomutase-like phosphatase (HAD superfamily)
MFKAIIFDVDGTLVNTEPLYIDAVNEVLQQFSTKLTKKDFIELAGRDPHSAKQAIYLMKQLSMPFAEFSEDVTEGFRRKLEDLPPAVPGSRELIKCIAACGLPLGLVTSGRRDNLARKLPDDILNHFDFNITVDDVSHPKPHPEPYELAIDKLNLSASDVLVFEDSDVGIESALAAGANVIARKNRFSNESDILSRCLHVIEDYHDTKLKEILSSSLSY